MNIKHLFLICVVVGQVRSDCDGYLKCLGDFVQDFLGVNKNGTDIERNDTLNDTKGVKNGTVGVYDLSDIGKSLSQALTDVTGLIKDELQGLFDVKQETDVHKEENNTEIHVRAFSLHNVTLNGTTTIIKLPDVITNNLTEFNNELNALKVELEKNLQAEIDDFIAKILENDTLDWEEVTDDLDSAETTTQTSQLHNNSTNITTTTPKEIDNITTTESVVTTKQTTEVSIKTTESNITTNAPTINKKEESTTKLVNIDVTSTTVDPIITVNKTDSTDVTTAAALKLRNEYTTNISTTTIPPTTTETENLIEINKSTITPEETTKDEVIKPETQTKAPIDYKLIENVQENEISKDDSYLDIEDDNTTDYPMIDYIEIYKDTTNEDVDYIPTEVPKNIELSDTDNTIEKEDAFLNTEDNAYSNDTSRPSSIFPWIAAIFIKNETNNQFEYYCDGVLLSETIVLTAGRCIRSVNKTEQAENIIVFLGKRSLQANGDDERIYRVTQIILHENFTLDGNRVDNDLAALRIEEPAVYNDAIQSACILGDGDAEQAVTTAWDSSLTVVRFVETSTLCGKNASNNTLCASFGNTVPLCPSFGGAYAVKLTDSWCLRGIRTADPTNRGFCIDKTVTYTDLNKYKEWIDVVLK